MDYEKVYAMKFEKIYPLLTAKAEKKGRTREEVQRVICWLTGYTIEEIENAAKNFDIVVTVEEHNIIGGFGGAVAEVMAEMKERKARLLRIGLNDEYSIRVGDQKYLRQQYGMDCSAIVNKIRRQFE